jgi:hypothetical protein
MSPRVRAFLLADAAGELGRADGPFRGPRLLARVAPFVGVAILAEASLALPPGPQSAPAVVTSVLQAAGFSGLCDLARQAGVTVGADTTADGVRLAWQIPLRAAAGAGDG